MKFINLIESVLSLNVRTNDIKKWNILQKDLWEKLVGKKEVEKNDVNTFIKFAKFFYSFVETNKKTPTIKQIEKELKIGRV